MTASTARCRQTWTDVKQSAWETTAAVQGAGELLGAGLKHHQAGRFAEAEACYQRVLAIQSDHADALHLLGVIAHQVRRYDLAVELIGRAIKRNGENRSIIPTSAVH